MRCFLICFLVIGRTFVEQLAFDFHWRPCKFCERLALSRHLTRQAIRANMRELAEQHNVKFRTINRAQRIQAVARFCS